jgi:PKD repeat protein
LPYTPINFISLNYDKEKIRVGTYRGIWENNLYETTAPKANIALSKKILGVEGTDSDEEDSDQMKVYFYDNSVIKGKGAKFNWEFPGAIPATSDEENPIVNYSACKPGMYSVKLTVTDSKGRKSDFELKNYIEVKNNYPWNLREKKLEIEEHEDEGDE